MKSGFDLVLGKHYNDGWFNEHSPIHNAAVCTRCHQRTATIHQLQKLVLAFGNITTKHCTIWTCSSCLHEEVVSISEKPKQKATKRNLSAIFAKLPKSVQSALLKGDLN